MIGAASISVIGALVAQAVAVGDGALTGGWRLAAGSAGAPQAGLGAMLRGASARAQAAARLPHLPDLLRQHPVALLETLDRVVGMQKEVLFALAAGDTAAAEEVRQRAVGMLQSGDEPAYPFEPLLDVDYINDANNYLEGFINDTEADLLRRRFPPSPAAAPPAALLCRTVETPSVAEEVPALPVTAALAGNGTECLFGVVPADEGLHCVQGLGPLGWCYTRRDRSEWGTCGADCPLFGSALQLGGRAPDRLQGRLRRLLVDSRDAAGRDGGA